MPDKKYISKITLPNGNSYELKDLEARADIAELKELGLKFVISTNAATTPYGVEWYDGDTKITGTLVASASIHAIYLVSEKVTPSGSATGDSGYREFACVQSGSSYIWELIGNTDVTIDNLGDLAYKDTITVTKGNGDMVLGEDTTITAAASAVTFTGTADDTFVKSYPGVETFLETGSIFGTSGTVSVSQVSASEQTATNTVFGEDTVASKITTAAKTATNTVFGEATQASKATAGTAVALAKAAAAATNVSYIGNSSTNSILEAASVNEETETLSFASTSVSQGSVTGTNGTETITPYTFSNVTVPVVSSNTTVSFDAVASAADVTVPVVSSNTTIKADKVTITNVNAAVRDAEATTIATGSTSGTGTGAKVLSGLGTAVTADAITGLGTAQAAAQAITVGNNDRVKVINYNDLDVSAS